MDRITIRLTSADADAIATIANAMRTKRNPFVTRSAVIKLALKVVSEDPKQFVKMSVSE